MSTQCKFGSAADARQAGWVSRRYQSLTDRDTAMQAHLKRQWDALTPEQQTHPAYKLPMGVRQAKAVTKAS